MSHPLSGEHLLIAFLHGPCSLEELDTSSSMVLHIPD